MGKDNSQFWRLVEAEHRKARGYCFKLTGSGDDGDDLYQDSILTAFKGFGQLRQIESFRPWLYKIIGNAFRARFRNPWWKRISRIAAEPGVNDATTNPSNQYGARMKLDYALKALSPDDRIIITLASLEGWKIAEVAELMSKSEGTIKMRLTRARGKMRKVIGDRYRNYDPNSNEEAIAYAVSQSSKNPE